MRCSQDRDAESNAGVQIEPFVTPSIGHDAAAVNVKELYTTKFRKGMRVARPATLDTAPAIRD